VAERLQKEGEADIKLMVNFITIIVRRSGATSGPSGRPIWSEVPVRVVATSDVVADGKDHQAA
jgi:hypothetical protein